MTKFFIGGAAALASLFVLPLFLLGLVGAIASNSTQAPETGQGSGTVDMSVGTCAPECPGVDGVQDIDVQKMLQFALAEVGTTRQTGWAMPGECISSVQRWVAAAGGHFGCCGANDGYIKSGAVRVTDGSLRPGDVIQHESLIAPNSFLPGVHTYMIAKVHDDGTFDIVESNWNLSAPGLVEFRPNQTFHHPHGFQSAVWRFAKKG